MPKKKNPSAGTANLRAPELESAGATRRASRLTPKLSAEIVKTFAESGLLAQAALAAGIELGTLYGWLERGRKDERREERTIYRELGDALSFHGSKAKPAVMGPTESEPPVGALVVDIGADGSMLRTRIAPPSKPLKEFTDELEACGVNCFRLFQIVNGQLPPHINLVGLYNTWCAWQAQKQRILQKVERATGKKVDPDTLSRAARDLRPADVGIPCDDAALLIMDPDELDLVKREIRVFYQMLAEFQLPGPIKHANEERGLSHGFRGLFTVGLDAPFSGNQFFTPIIAALMEVFGVKPRRSTRDRQKAKGTGVTQAWRDVARFLHLVCPDLENRDGYPDAPDLVKRRYCHWLLHKSEYSRTVRARAALQNPIGDGRNFQADDVFRCPTVYANHLLRLGLVEKVKTRATCRRLSSD